MGAGGAPDWPETDVAPSEVSSTYVARRMSSAAFCNCQCLEHWRGVEVTHVSIVGDGDDLSS